MPRNSQKTGHEGDPFFPHWGASWEAAKRRTFLKGGWWWCISSTFNLILPSNFQHVWSPTSDLWNATPRQGVFKWWPPSADRTRSSKSPKSCAASHNTLAAAGGEKKRHGPEILGLFVFLDLFMRKKNLGRQQGSDTPSPKPHPKDPTSRCRTKILADESHEIFVFSTTYRERQTSPSAFPSLDETLRDLRATHRFLNELKCI